MFQTLIKNFLRLLTGFTAGVVNGLLGSGGGIILIYALPFLADKPHSLNPRDNFAMNIGMVAVMSLVSAAMYWRAGNIDLAALLPLLLPAVGGGLLGAFLLNKIRLDWLGKIFAAVVIYAGVTMLVR